MSPYTYQFIPAGDPIQTPPKESYKADVQATIRDYFYQSSDWYTIQEETSVGTETYSNVDVRVNNIVNPTTGDNVEDDFKKILFQELDHSVDLGKMYQFDSNYWVTVNVDKIKTLTQTILVRRCNNVLRWLDEETGALYEVPCALTYLIKENRDYSTAGSAIVVPSGMTECFVQNNSKTKKIKPNQRFLFGNPQSWTAYRVEGGGINNYNNQKTTDNSSATLMRLSLAVDFANPQTDDFVNGIANVYDNVYSLTLDQQSISGEVSQTVQLVASVTLNGDSVTVPLTWTSDDLTVATVSITGVVTFVGLGDCSVTCSIENNSLVSDSCEVQVLSTPVDNYQVTISPDSNYVYEGTEKTWEVYLYKNGVQQSDTFTFSLDSNDIPSSYYEYTVIDGNSFKINNIRKFLSSTLDITCTTGIYSGVASISLRGAW